MVSIYFKYSYKTKSCVQVNIKDGHRIYHFPAHQTKRLELNNSDQN